MDSERVSSTTELDEGTCSPHESTCSQHEGTFSPLDEGVTCSPQEWVQRANQREIPILLEHRLAHFIDWMEKRGATFAGKSGAAIQRNKVHELVEEYVNT